MTVNVPAEFEDFVRNAVASGAFEKAEDVVRRGLQLVEQELKTAAEAAQPERQGGQWKGRVRIADDFDELPADLEAALGMRDG